jgi:hypothetical protein
MMRDLMVRLAGVQRSSCQIAVDRGVHMLMQWTLPTLFTELSQERPLSWHIASSRVEAGTRIDWQRRGWQPIPIHSGIGLLKPHVRIIGTVRPGRPLVIWHHGAGEFPVDAAVSNLWACGGLDLPLALVRATGHHDYRSYARQMATSDGAAGLLASSALALEEVRRQWGGPVLIGGLSLGGMVDLIHARVWGAAAVAAAAPVRWLPIAAGPDTTAVLRRSGFRRLTCDLTLRHDRLDDLLALQDHPFLPAVAARIHPLLAQWDQIHCFRDQIAAYRDAGIAVEVAARGHIGLSVDGRTMSRHLQRSLARLEADLAAATRA